MSRYNHYRKTPSKAIFIRVLGVVVTVAILAIGLPKAGIVKYQYQIGEPWDEDPVIAQDSFPVFKSEERMQQERDSLRSYYEPYFRVDPEVEAGQIDSFIRCFDADLQKVIPKHYKKHVEEQLAYVYSRGIISLEDYDRLKNDNTRNVRLYQQNNSSVEPVSYLFTEKSAYEYLMNTTDTIHIEHDKLAQCNLSRFLWANMTYDPQKSEQQRIEVDNMMVPYMGQVLSGQKIVDKGQIVDEYIFQELISMEQHQQQQAKSITEIVYIMVGKIILLAILVILLLIYFIQFRSDFLLNYRNMLFVMVMYLIFPLITYQLVENNMMSVFIIPYCILPILLRVFQDSRTAFTTHIITILTCAISLQHPYEFILIQSLAGMVAVFSLQQLQQRSDLFRAIILVTGSALFIKLSIDLIQGNLFKPTGVDTYTYIYLIIAGALSLMAYLLLIPIERIFRFTSAVTLVELSNINNPLLRTLSEEAPGTFQHSMQVSNLAAEVANRLGAKSLLVRIGALYHDIGKMENPGFFTENQNLEEKEQSSEKNPHNGLSSEKSAQIIIKHVTDGMKLAEKHGLPRVIRDFIITHHGHGMTKYFYLTIKNANPDREIDKSIFTYPGPNPTTIEQAILTMADSVEAASHSLKQYDDNSIDNLVENIVGEQMKDGLFEECAITLQEIRTAKETLKEKLRTIYHTRIQYPKEKG